MQNEAKTRLFSWIDKPLNAKVPKKETKNKLLFGLTIPVYIWYILSGVLVHCTQLESRLEGADHLFFVLITGLYDYEIYWALHDIWAGVCFALFTFFAIALNKGFSKRQRRIFILIPIAAFVINLTAAILWDPHW